MGLVVHTRLMTRVYGVVVLLRRLVTAIGAAAAADCGLSRHVRGRSFLLGSFSCVDVDSRVDERSAIAHFHPQFSS